jgi:hypothetical protein
MNDIIILTIFILIYIDYYYKKYRIKHSKKDIRPRNSHSNYDFTNYKKYKPYKKNYIFKILIIFLIIILIINIITKYK